jgi:tripartite-type tricarboxylate transporter receptor subunit TctC
MLSRRSLLVTPALLAGLAVPRPSAAATYPDHAVRVLNPWPPGGPADIACRPICERLSERLGQPFVMENKAGANGTIATAQAAAAAGDGYTLLYGHVGPTTISPALQKLPYNPAKDFAPVANAVTGAIVLIVRPTLPVHNVPELIAYAKAHPSELSYASVGPGSTTHFAGELLKKGAGIDMLHVPFKGSTPALTELIAGRIDVMFISIGGLQPFVKSGQVRALAVTNKTRAPLMPDLPPMADYIPDFEVNSWYGFLAPAATPRPIVDLLNKEIVAALTDPELAKRLQEVGLEPQPGTPEDFGRRISSDLVYWAKAVATTGIRLED